MDYIIALLKQQTDFFCEEGASEEAIRKAEDALGLPFADDYKAYVQQFGSVSCGGHELTGFSRDKSLDVVRVTRHNLQKNPNINMPLYVVEETHIDGIVIWQAGTGEIYQADYQAAPRKVYESLSEYVSTFGDNLL